MAAGSTYTPIATTKLSVDTANITFSSISGSYTDLVLVMNARSTRADYSSPVWLQFNSDTSGNYSYTYLYAGSGSIGYGSTRYSNDTGTHEGEIFAASSTTGSFSTLISNLENYSNTTTYKTSLSRSSSAPTAGNSYDLEASVSLWRSTAAINSIKINTVTGFKAGSMFTLYGIKAA